MALRASRRAWRRFHNPVDLVMSMTAGIWLLHLLATTALIFVAGNFPSFEPVSVYVAQLGYQTLMTSIGVFLLTCAGVASARVYLLPILQLVAGMVALHWLQWTRGAPSVAYGVWIGINLLAAVLVTAAVIWRVRHTRTYPAWLALAGCLINLGLCIDQVTLADSVRRLTTLSDDFFAAYLIMTWHLVTRRLGSPEMNTGFVPEFQHSAGLEPLTGFGPARDATSAAVAAERRRIAQDLHDGVGSQIVSILSTLDCKAPQQKAVALALEHCLVDLKMTVDAMDSADDNLLEALGRLRYRIQHSLDSLGIRMVWQVELCDELEAVQGRLAQQVLRIAQESLSNVMRHSQASAVEVVCRFVPETRQLFFQVRDNGRGVDRGKEKRASGKGLDGMHRRALAVGGTLDISSSAVNGTRVRLSLPLTQNLVQSQSEFQSSGHGGAPDSACAAADQTLDRFDPKIAG